MLRLTVQRLAVLRLTVQGILKPVLYFEDGFLFSVTFSSFFFHFGIVQLNTL